MRAELLLHEVGHMHPPCDALCRPRQKESAATSQRLHFTGGRKKRF